MSDEAVQPQGTGFFAGFASRRLRAVSLLSISSGLPLGAVWILTPFWLTKSGVDIKTVGFLTLAQIPWAFKMLWAPLMDRYTLPFLGRKRGWIFVSQVLLALATAGLMSQSAPLDLSIVGGLTLLIAFAGASQDIAYDAWSVEVLDKKEFTAAASSRNAMYRMGMWIAGNIAITLGPSIGWRWTWILLSVIYVLLLPVTIAAPEPQLPPAPLKTVREAVWEPFVGFLRRPQALQIAAFIMLYRAADSLAGALTSPFLTKLGYTDSAVGIERGTVVFFTTVLGAMAGGALTNRFGLSRSLWICGVLQALSNLAYAALALVPIVADAPKSFYLGVLPADRVHLYAALSIESYTSAMGSTAFGVLILQLTSKRFSATQFALFSSLIGVTRTLMGPIAGILVDAVGWATFFVVTVFASLPGFVFLHIFSPWGREPRTEIHEDAPRETTPWSSGSLWSFGAIATLVGTAFAMLSIAFFASLKTFRTTHTIDYPPALRAVVLPATASDWIDFAGAVVFGLIVGMVTAAYFAARGQPRSRGEVKESS